MKTLSFIIISFVLLISGCDKPMTRAEIIAAVKECEDAGMQAQIIMNGFTYKPYYVHCIVKEN